MKASDKKTVKPRELLVIDSHAMVYRAYYALKVNLVSPLTGLPSQAVFGFFRMLLKVISERKPDYIAVAWDPPGGSFRNEAFSEYKANRPSMPDDLRPQIKEIKEILTKLGIPQIELPGYEADDIMGTLSRRASADLKVTLITGDKDCYQLLNDHVHMLRGAKGVSEFTEIDPLWVREETGVEVSQIRDYMAITGDPSDNIPGAHGIGEKGAARLIATYGNIENIYSNIGSVTPAGIREKLIKSKDKVFLSKELATIRTDVPEILSMATEDLACPDLFTRENADYFLSLGFRQIHSEILKESGSIQDGRSSAAGPEQKAPGFDAANAVPGQTIDSEKTEYRMAKSASDLKDIIKILKNSDIISVDTETDSVSPVRASLVGISLSDRPGRAWYVPVFTKSGSLFESGRGLDWNEVREILREILEDPGIKKTGQNIKYDYIVLKNHGIELRGIFFDTMIGSYLLNPGARRHNLDDMAMDLLGHQMITYEEITGKGKNKLTMDQLPPEAVRDYACEDADITLRIFRILSERIEKENLSGINRNMELRLIPVLASMEMAGVAVDIPYFQKMSADFASRIQETEEAVYEATGTSFNINSTKDLQKILFEHLKLPAQRKTKTGYSTDQETLEALSGYHPVIPALLQYRKLTKLKSTYIDALPALVYEKTGRIHTSFNQTVTATGRLSSADPNLQNIPVREEEGRAIRRGFIAAPGNELLSLDYSQIELRIMAHYSGDEHLIEAFTKDDIDIHRRTASGLFKVPEDQVNADMRARAKIVNFSIIYGVTDFGLASSLGISREEAKLYIDRFFEKYPGVRRFMDKAVEEAERTGYSITLTGRKRPLSDIRSGNRMLREAARRNAINSPIQGTSADIIKIAMIKIFDEFRKRKLRSQMILQVHDELLFDTVPDEKAEVLEIAKREMENALKLDVPLKTEYRFGKNWDEAH